MMILLELYLAYLYFFILTLPIVFISFFTDNKSNKILAGVIVFLYLLIFGLGYKVGVDWIAYEESYRGIIEQSYFEIGYQFLEFLGNSIGLDYWLFAFIIKFLLWIFLLKIAFDFSEHPTLIVYFTILLSTVYLNDYIRQMSASIFVFIAIIYFNKDLFKYVLFIGIASTFHKSAALALPFYFIYNSIFLERTIIFAMISLFISSLFGLYITDFIIKVIGSIINNQYIERLEIYTAFKNDSFSMGHVLRFLILVTSIIIYKYQTDNFKSKNRWIYIGFICAFMYEMIFYDIGILWTRSREYFVIFIPLFLLAISNRNKIYFIIFLFAYSSYTFFGIYKNNNELFLNYSNYKNSLDCWLNNCEEKNLERKKEVDNYWNNWYERNL